MNMISSWTATATNIGFESRMRKPACFAAGGFFQKADAVGSRKGRLIDEETVNNVECSENGVEKHENEMI